MFPALLYNWHNVTQCQDIFSAASVESDSQKCPKDLKLCALVSQSKNKAVFVELPFSVMLNNDKREEADFPQQHEKQATKWRNTILFMHKTIKNKKKQHTMTVPLSGANYIHFDWKQWDHGLSLRDIAERSGTSWARVKINDANSYALNITN